ncbi:MAG: glycerate dehydrogenase, partial [Halioglobus sp.]
MQGVFLDTSTLGEELDFSRLRDALPAWQFHDLTPPGKVAERLAGAQVVLTNKVVLDAQTLAQAGALKLVCVTATGTNNVDLAAARRAGIAVCNVRDYAGPSVVQHVLALMLGLATQWQRYDSDVRAGQWSRADSFCLMHHPVTEL